MNPNDCRGTVTSSPPRITVGMTSGRVLSLTRRRICPDTDTNLYICNTDVCTAVTIKENQQSINQRNIIQGCRQMQRQTFIHLNRVTLELKNTQSTTNEVKKVLPKLEKRCIARQVSQTSRLTSKSDDAGDEEASSTDVFHTLTIVHRMTKTQVL